MADSLVTLVAVGRTQKTREGKGGDEDQHKKLRRHSTGAAVLASTNLDRRISSVSPEPSLFFVPRLIQSHARVCWNPGTWVPQIGPITQGPIIGPEYIDMLKLGVLVYNMRPMVSPWP